VAMLTSITLHHATVDLGSAAPALDSVTASFKSGQIIGLIGPSGSGKTTFMRSVVGQQALHDGTVSVLGLPAGNRQLRQRVSYMTQSPAVYSDLTVRQNLDYFSKIIGQGRGSEEVLELVELTRQADQLVGQLSGGQRQRVSLGVALLGSPEVLILDEPTVGLDPVLRSQLWRLLRSLANDGVTLLVSSHVMDEAERCDDILLLRDGKVLAHGTPEQLKKHTKTSSIEAAFISLVGAAQ
jgi:ABC-2 type transport system ATP-binding protein